MKFQAIIKKIIVCFFGLTLLSLTGCSTPQISIHNEEEAISLAKEELLNFCQSSLCEAKAFNAPIEIVDISNSKTGYQWRVEFYKKENPQVHVFVLVSDYGGHETHFLLEEQLEKRAKDRKENPWKYN